MNRALSRPVAPRRALPGSIAVGADDLSVHFEGLANPTRLAVVELLAGIDEVRVSELADLCHVSQPRMSWHLRILRRAQIVRTRNSGREVYCRLDRESIAEQQRRFNDILSPRAGGGASVRTASQSITEVKS